MGHLAIAADDGTQPARAHKETGDWGRVGRNGDAAAPLPKAPSLLDTARGRRRSRRRRPRSHRRRRSRRNRRPCAAAVPAPKGSTPPRAFRSSSRDVVGEAPPLVSASGEIVIKPPPEALAGGMPAPRAAQSMEIAKADEITQPDASRRPGARRAQAAADRAGRRRRRIAQLDPRHRDVPHRSGEVAGEIASKVAPGARVLVPGPNGLMQSATVRQLLQGYYELEVGRSGETIWVPFATSCPSERSALHWDVVVVTVLSVFTALLVRSDDEEGTRWWHDIEHEHHRHAVVVPAVAPTPPPPPPANAKPRLQAEDIEDAASTTRALTNRCWAISLKHRPLNAMEVKRVVATLAVETDGHVTHIDLAGVPDDDGGLRGCLTTVLSGWHMPATKTAASYDVTLAFQ